MSPKASKVACPTCGRWFHPERDGYCCFGLGFVAPAVSSLTALVDGSRTAIHSAAGA